MFPFNAVQIHLIITTIIGIVNKSVGLLSHNVLKAINFFGLTTLNFCLPSMHAKSIVDIQDLKIMKLYL